MCRGRNLQRHKMQDKQHKMQDKQQNRLGIVGQGCENCRPARLGRLWSTVYSGRHTGAVLMMVQHAARLLQAVNPHHAQCIA